MIVLVLAAIEVGLIPFDLGKFTKDDNHPYEHKIFVYLSKGPGLSVTRFYSRNGLFLAKLFGALTWLLLIVFILYAYALNHGLV